MEVVEDSKALAEMEAMYEAQITVLNDEIDRLKLINHGMKEELEQTRAELADAHETIERKDKAIGVMSAELRQVKKALDQASAMLADTEAALAVASRVKTPPPAQELAPPPKKGDPKALQMLRNQVRGAIDMTHPEAHHEHMEKHHLEPLPPKRNRVTMAAQMLMTAHGQKKEAGASAMSVTSYIAALGKKSKVQPFGVKVARRTSHAPGSRRGSAAPTNHWSGTNRRGSSDRSNRRKGRLGSVGEEDDEAARASSFAVSGSPSARMREVAKTKRKMSVRPEGC